jgi:hypothetical protein
MNKINYLFVLIIASHVLFVNCGILGESSWQQNQKRVADKKVEPSAEMCVILSESSIHWLSRSGNFRSEYKTLLKTANIHVH